MRLAILTAALLLAAPVAAQQADLSALAPGPVFTEFGPHAPVEGVAQFPVDTEFAIAFDVKDPAPEGGRNRGFESGARFINMHAAHGVDPDNIRIAVVVHGKAVLDLVKDEARSERQMPANASGAMVSAMLEHGVRYIVCGQSAAAYGVSKGDLIDGVELNLSAMTAHAQLQQRGYTVNPF